MTQVGVSHDVVIYDSAGNIPPVGLVVKPFSYRVGEAPTFIPRMAVGDPRGTDYATFVSHVEEDWRGRSQRKKGDSHSYWAAVGIAPDRRTGDMTLLSPPYRVKSNTLLNLFSSPLYAMRVPTCVGVNTQIYSAQCSDTRVFVDNFVMMPHKVGDNFTKMYAICPIPYSFSAYDAVQYSSVAFVTTYGTTGSGDDRSMVWHGIFAHVNDTVYAPVASTLGQALAVYDDKLWRSEPDGHRIAYYEIREPPEVQDTSQGTLSYLGDGGSAEFRDEGQDFSEWQTEEGDASYKIVVTNSDASECWGYLGTANNDNKDIDVYREKDLSTRGWLGDTTTPYADGKTPSTYEVRTGVPPEEEVTAWSDWIDLSPDSRIRAMEPFIGRLFIGCEGALWAYEAGRTYKVADFTHLADRRNFFAMEGGYGSLWFNIGSMLYRYTAGGLLEEIDFVPKRYGSGGSTGIPRSIASGPGCVYVVVGDMGIGYWKIPTLWRIDTETGACQELLNMSKLIWNSWYATETSVFTARTLPVSEVHPWGETQLLAGPMYSTCLGTNAAQMFLNFGNLSELLAATEIPMMGAYGASPDVHFFETCWIDIGYPALDKTWQRVKLTVDLNAWQSIDVYYRVSEQASYTLLGTILLSDLDAEGAAVLDFTSLTVSKSIQLKVGFSLDTTGPQTRMVVTRLELDCLIKGTSKKQISFDAVVTDDMELLDMTVENSAAFVTTSLYSFVQSGTPHIVALPFPPPVGHTTRARIQLGSVGAVVPILPASYSALSSGCPGADFHVIITEV